MRTPEAGEAWHYRTHLDGACKAYFIVAFKGERGVIYHVNLQEILVGQDGFMEYTFLGDWRAFWHSGNDCKSGKVQQWWEE
jgi:hypothetical protein